MSILLLLVLALLTREHVFAQQPNRPGFKEPGTATLFGVLLVGGGHLYAGETSKGVGLLGGSIGAIVLGAVLSTEASCDITGFSVSCKEENITPLYVGLAASLGLWLYGILDAPEAARRMNSKNGYTQSHRFKVQPVAVFQGKQVRPGVKLSLSL